MTPKKTKTKTKKKRPSRIQKNKLAKIFLLILLIALVASTFSYFMMKKESHKASKTVKIDNILEIKKQTDENQTPKNENTNNDKSFLEKYDNLKVKKIVIPENVFVEEDEFGGVYISHKNKYLDGFYIIKFIKKG